MSIVKVDIAVVCCWPLSAKLTTIPPPLAVHPLSVSTLLLLTDLSIIHVESSLTEVTFMLVERGCILSCFVAVYIVNRKETERFDPLQAPPQLLASESSQGPQNEKTHPVTYF